MSAVRFCLRAPFLQSRHTVSTPERRPVHSVSGHHFFKAATLCRPRNAGRFILSPGTISSKPPHCVDPGTPAGSFCLRAPFLQSRHTVSTPERRPVHSVSGHHFFKAATLCRPRNAGRFILSPGTISSKPPHCVDPGTPAGSFCLRAPFLQSRHTVSTPERRPETSRDCRPTSGRRVPGVSSSKPRVITLSQGGVLLSWHPVNESPAPELPGRTRVRPG